MDEALESCRVTLGGENAQTLICIAAIGSLHDCMVRISNIFYREFSRTFLGVLSFDLQFKCHG